MRLLFLGDVVGRAGRDAITEQGVRSFEPATA
jgi:calcineurin-like phosphoesterase